MANTQAIKSVIQLRRDLYTNFIAADPVLRAAEPAVCMPDSNNDPSNVEHAFELRIGDGTRRFSELPVIGSTGSSGSEVTVDSKSVIMNAAGEVALNGFADASVNYMPYKNSNGELGWMPIPTGDGEGADLAELVSKIDSNTNKITELESKVSAIETSLVENYYTKNEIDSKISSAYTPGETLDNISDLPSPPTEKDVGVIYPIVNGGSATSDFVDPNATIDDGDQVVAVKDPETGEIKYTVLPGGVMDISNLQDQVDKNTLDIASNTANIGANQTAIDNVRTDLLNNYYTKPEVDAKITSAYTPKPSVDNVSDLADPSTGNVGDLIPVENGGTTTDDFIGGAGQEIKPGDKVVIVEDESGNKKYDVLPGSEVDLSGYATNEALKTVEDMMVKGIKAGDTDLVRDVNGIVTLPTALQTQLGLVKSCDPTTENGIQVNSDGTMKLINMKVNINNLVQNDGDDLVLDGGGANA